jgi:transcriptional regulator with XRE-family HTH domain
MRSFFNHAGRMVGRLGSTAIRGGMAMQTPKVGPRITKYMAQNEITIEALAERTGLSVPLLESIRDDEACPSLGPLVKIARALGVRLGTFLDDQEGDDPLIVRRRERAGTLSTLRAKDRPVENRFYALGRGKTDRHMEPFFVELQPTDGQDRALSSHEGEEFVVVVEGRVEVVYGQATHTLEAGDSIYYNSIVPHHVGCAGETPAAIYAVLYIPE